MIFITAEIGVNWDGDLKLAEQMMVEAKKAGCNAVKFQAFNESIVKNHPEKERLLQTAISENNIEQINSIANKVGIEWYCTPMYPEAIDFLDSYVNRYKIRYHDSLDLHQNKTNEIISKVLKSDKEVIVSSQKNPKELELYENSNVKWLYVVPKYPCKIEELDFSNLKDFSGYSNHCTHFLAPLTAVILGAKMIEIHTTSNKEKNFVDNNVSFDSAELSQVINLIKIAERIQQ